MNNRYNNDWPNTLDDAVMRLIAEMSNEDKENLRATPEDDLISFHFDWGMSIRDKFGLWRGNSQLLESCGNPHPDDASMVVIEAVWRHLQHSP